MRIYRLESASGVGVSFIATGGAIVAIDSPDRNGERANVVLAHRDLGAYRAQSVYFGAVCGRYANRIANSAFELDGIRYALEATDGASSVHGGRRGFDKVEWAVSTGRDTKGDWAILTHSSPDGDQGYPGALAVTMTYRLDAFGALEIAYEATTDCSTVVNLTNHSYFNLAGEGSGDILDHVLEIAAAAYTPSDARLIPTGEIAAVAASPFDFRAGRPIGEGIRSTHPQMLAGRGYDVNYVMAPAPNAALTLACRAHDPRSGRSLVIETDQPGMQFYSGNNLDGALVGSSGRSYRQSDGFCLEPHHFPDTPNRPEFPSARLDPGQRYRRRTRYRFGVV
jgi:aldose 1-epimerase